MTMVTALVFVGMCFFIVSNERRRR